MESFAGKIAMVTGGASGIGRALCLELARRGAVVHVTDKNGPGAIAVASQIAKAGGRATSDGLDVTDFEAVKRQIDGLVERHGRIDLLFNNAGFGLFAEQRYVTVDDWRRVLDVLLMGVVYGVQAVYPHMVRQGSGHIVNTASVAGLGPTPFTASYCAGKHAVVGLSTSLRAEGAALGVKVSVVCPGFIDTPILVTSELRGGLDRQAMLAMTPKPMSPERCARIVLDGVARNRAIIVVTAFGWLLWALERLSPTLVAWIWKLAVARLRATARSSGAAES